MDRLHPGFLDDLKAAARWFADMIFDWNDRDRLADKVNGLAKRLQCIRESKRERINFQNANGFNMSLSDVDIFIDIDTFFDTYELSLEVPDFYGRIEQIIEEKMDRMEEIRAVLDEIWGEPFFAGDIEDDGFPRDTYFGMRIVLWKLRGAHAVLQVEWQDKELPVSLNLILTPEWELSSREYDQMTGRSG